MAKISQPVDQSSCKRVTTYKRHGCATMHSCFAAVSLSHPFALYFAHPFVHRSADCQPGEQAASVYRHCNKDPKKSNPLGIVRFAQFSIQAHVSFFLSPSLSRPLSSASIIPLVRVLFSPRSALLADALLVPCTPRSEFSVFFSLRRNTRHTWMNETTADGSLHTTFNERVGERVAQHSG